MEKDVEIWPVGSELTSWPMRFILVKVFSNFASHSKWCPGGAAYNTQDVIKVVLNTNCQYKL